MFRLLLLAALLLAGLTFTSSASAAGRWVTSCNGRTCQRVWVEDRPAAKPAAKPVTNGTYCTCQGCGPGGNCMVTGRATSQCVKCNCARQRSVLKPAQAKPVAREGWYFGKRLGF